MASPGNSTNPQTLFRPSSSSPGVASPPPPSSPAPYLTPSSSYPPPTGPYPFHHAQYMPYPPPQPVPGQKLPQDHQFFANLHRPNLYPPPSNPNPGGGARLMALLGTQNPTATPDFPPHHFSPSPSAPPDFLFTPQPPGTTASPVSAALLPNMPAAGLPVPMRMPSSKLPKGRHLIGDRVVYDIDVRLQGEVQPQLEVTPITKYVSDPGLVLGRQIAVNRSYICYGLKMGNIRVLNINTALRSLLRGHTQKVTDMAFFAEDVHLMASASNDGRIYIWKINEGPDEEEKAQITGKVVLAIQVVGEEEFVHPQLCWHPHKQEILMVAIGKHILKIDSTRVGKGGVFSTEEPMTCPLEKPIDGVQIVGEHEDVVTGLSMCQWMTTRLASASLDGIVKIWEDRRPVPLAVLRPHDGHPVNSVTFLTAPHQPDHIVLITGGTVNRELKIWTSAEEEGWLLPSDSESWRCTQTLEMKSSSAEAKVEDAFFNQVVALPHAGLLLLANAKKNAIYVIHIDYGVNPTSTRMDYIAEFTVTMPILSVTGTSETLVDGEHIVQVYCVQTQAIQQYALALSQCLPPLMENTELEKLDVNASAMADGHSNNDSSVLLSNISGAAADTTQQPTLIQAMVTCLPENTVLGVENKSSVLPSNKSFENVRPASPLSLSPRLSRKSSGFRSPSGNFEPLLPMTDHNADPAVVDYLVDMRVDMVNENVPQGDISKKNHKPDFPSVSGPAIFMHPTHLVTPTEILSTAPSSETQISQGANLEEVKVQDVVLPNNTENVEVEVKVVGESGTILNKNYEYERESHIPVDRKEKSFYSQASNLSIQMAMDFSDDSHVGKGTHISVNDGGLNEVSDQRPTNGETVQDLNNHAVEKTGNELDTLVVTLGKTTNAKGKKERGKGSQAGPSSSKSSPFNSTDSSNGPDNSSNAPSTDSAVSHLLAMQEMLDQVVAMQKDMQKQISAMVTVPVNKEGKRLEASLVRNMDKITKANTDALWARFQEENAKHDKLERDRTQQITHLITNCLNKDLPAVIEKMIKREIAVVGQVVTRAVTPVLEKCISSAIAESFQKGVGDKAATQLEKAVTSKLEGTVTRQIQAQFQTSGKQALQDALRSSLEALVIPAFEMQCKAMFEQIDGTLQNGLVKHLTAAQQQYDSTHSPLAIALRDAINSASSITQTLSGELAEGQRKLMEIAVAGAGSSMNNPLVTKISNGPLVGLREMQPEVKIDPTKELSRLVSEHKYEEAFAMALHRSDVAIVSWLCFQVDLGRVLGLVPMPLSQGVLLALLQQLAYDISSDTSKKLSWMTDVAMTISPGDPVIAVHVRPIFDQVYQILGHHRNLPTVPASEASSIRLLMHVINSVLMSCK
ncbi:hypothetical protein SAY87_008873 [Trapa incisa]|uniref:Enhancer of mRNA-decapping protein 4 n=1 Tax=Trapa incisa TaxID=236973 RepID=A0AAN7PWL0_9MYRT|nr:hypothetical protein SAY87_008873 [Trapa incisa]